VIIFSIEVVPYHRSLVSSRGRQHWLSLSPRKAPLALTLMDDESPFLQRLAEAKEGMLISNTAEGENWKTFPNRFDLSDCSLYRTGQQRAPDP
jgi:hypothetical protein